MDVSKGTVVTFIDLFYNFLRKIPDEYVAIHNEYKNLVDYMLGSFMEEMNISPEQFELACLEGKNLNMLPKEEPSDSHSFSFHRGLFQQIWAANDIRIFCKLMVQRNVEIQLQALDLIERRQASLQENENAESAIESELNEVEIEKFVDETGSDTLENEAEVNESSEDKFRRLNLFFEKEKINANEVSQRQEYLRSQRDKILQIRKQARARQLNVEATKDRPISARAAQKFIDGQSVAGGSGSDSARISSARLLLARKLREEVVDKTTDGEHEK